MRRVWAAAALWMACGGPAAAQIVSVALHPARDFGILVGDALSATATISVGPDTVLDKDALPQPGPVGPSIDLRQVAVSQSPNGSLVTLKLDYQSFVAPPQVTTAEVPGYTAVFRHAGQRLAASVPGFTFTASPFRHDLQAATDPALLRKDHPPVLARDAAAPWLTIAGGLLALAAGLCLLAGRLWPGRGIRSPFAEADRDVARMARKHHDMSGALTTLHRAFDATAGRPVLTADIADFLARQPHFVPLRHDIETFFAWSRAAFFDPAACTPSWPELTRLARVLRRAERS